MPNILIGIAIDNKDGHTRITRGDGLYLEGGCHESHQLMQEIGIKVQERARSYGKKLSECGPSEMRDHFYEVVEKW